MWRFDASGLFEKIFINNRFFGTSKKCNERVPRNVSSEQKLKHMRSILKF